MSINDDLLGDIKEKVEGSIYFKKFMRGCLKVVVDQGIDSYGIPAIFVTFSTFSSDEESEVYVRNRIDFDLIEMGESVIKSALNRIVEESLRAFLKHLRDPEVVKAVADSSDRVQERRKANGR